MNIKFKKIDKDVKTPFRASDGAACFDLYAHTMKYDRNYIEYDTGVCFEIPENYVGLVFPRSSISKLPSSVFLRNHVGVIDSDYRGSIKLRYSSEGFVHFVSTKGQDYNLYRVGDAVGQIMFLPIPEIELQESDELSDTNRGSGGFGSTDVKLNKNYFDEDFI